MGKAKIKQTTFIFNLGDRVKDVVSGYEGVVVGRFEYWTGCNHYGVEAPATGNGKCPYETIDEQRLEICGEPVKLVREYGVVDLSTETVPKRRSPGTAPRSPMPRA